MKKDAIEYMFGQLEGQFDLHEVPTGHERRFLEKLNHQDTTIKKGISIWKPLSIAASFIVLIGLGITLNSAPIHTADLASVSPEMEQTQAYFKATIEKELETLQSFQNPETRVLIEDALAQINILEEEYLKLKSDLAISGNDKRVIYAMINNFQKRIALLQQVITTLEEINNFKNNSDEITL